MNLRSFVPWLVGTSVLTTAAIATASEPLDAIDKAYSAGQISYEQRIVYRLAAVRGSPLLPEAFRQTSSMRTTRCYSPITIASHQALPRLSVNAANQVRALLGPPPDPPYSVESAEPFPIRVSYSDPALADRAQRVLEAAETSFERQVTEIGFRAPPIDPAQQVYRFYLGDAEGAAGYTSPYATVDDTPHSDAYSFIVIDTSLDGFDLDVTTTHEFNHACQLSMDAEEIIAFFENTATFMEGQVFPSALPYVAATFPYFQSQPHRPLEYMSMFDSDLYEYGGSLFATFLVETYGDNDPRFLAEVWTATMQEDENNEPDYFDVLDDRLEDDGGMRGVAKAFAESRFFIGEDDDGRHLQHASNWNGSEVERVATWSLNQLPLVDQGPSGSATKPLPNGCNYIVLRTGQSPPPLQFTFSGAPDVPWSVGLLELGNPTSTPRHEVAIDPDGKGELLVEPGDFEGLVAIVCQLGHDGYDPDARAWLPAGYSYGFDYGYPAPVVSGVTPPQIERGAHDVTLTIKGSGFTDDEGLEVGVVGGDVKMWVEEVLEETLVVRASAPPSIPLGLRDIIVTNPGGKSGVGVGLLTVVDPPTPVTPPNPPAPEEPPASTPDNVVSDDGSAGGCQINHQRGNGAWWILALAAAVATTLRSRRR